MIRRLTVCGLLFASVLANAQTGKKQSRRKVPTVSAPECSQGSICFSGEIREGQEFRRAVTEDLDFVLQLPGGFDIVFRAKEPLCMLSSWVANPPLRAHHDTEIAADYDWTAEQEVQTSPREFRFVTTCADYQTLLDLSQNDATKYFANRELLAKGQGRLWITDSRVTHSHGTVSKEQGAIEWIKFSVEIKIPDPN